MNEHTLYSIAATVSQSTCNEACWHAVDDVCRCSCGGRNHGIFRRGGERPDRTSRIRGVWYRLAAVGELLEISNEARQIKLAAESNGDRRWFDAAFSSPPRTNQRLWPEVENCGLRDPYMLWVRIDTSSK